KTRPIKIDAAERRIFGCRSDWRFRQLVQDLRAIEWIDIGAVGVDRYFSIKALRLHNARPGKGIYGIRHCGGGLRHLTAIVGGVEHGDNPAVLVIANPPDSANREQRNYRTPASPKCRPAPTDHGDHQPERLRQYH